MKTKLFSFILTALLLTSCTGMITKFVHMAKDHEDLTDVAPADTVKVMKTKQFEQQFSKITFIGAYDVEIVQGDCDITMKYKGRKVYWDNINLEVRGDELIVSSNTEKYARGKIYITMPAVTTLTVDGACDIEIENFSQNEDLNVTSAGACDVDIKSARFGNVSINIAGAGDIEVKSLTCKDFKGTISGAGDAEIERIVADNLYVKISGSGDVKASGRVNKSDIVISGAGSIDDHKLEAKESSNAKVN